MKKITKILLVFLLTFSIIILKVDAVTFDTNNLIGLPEEIKRDQSNKIEVNLSSSYSSYYIFKDVTQNEDFISAYEDYKINSTAKDSLEQVIEEIITNDNFERMESDEFTADNIPEDSNSTMLLVVKVSYNDPDSGENVDVYKYKVNEYNKIEKEPNTGTNGNKTEEKNSDTGITDVLYIAVPALLIIGTATLNKKRYE